MADLASDYYKLVQLLGQSDAVSTLFALAEGKTGNCEYHDFLPTAITENAEAASYDFVKLRRNMEPMRSSTGH